MNLTGLVALRCEGKPLRQPNYSMRHVPHTSKDLSNSVIYEISERDHFNDSMAEFVLLCNEVVRRKAVKYNVKSSKPLSLEYMADRLDVDDPVFGFMVRTNEIPAGIPSNQKDYFQEGMLQGFITVTTFTNWQQNFRWDSMHDSAFAYDEPTLAAQMHSNERVWDRDGSLAEALQNTVRCGDPWNEGIVWPKIAEISLIGALGCGKALLSLVIERLEAMQPNRKQNYDYVVLQATENSIPFYESMGFVRVGCITEQRDKDVEEVKQQEIVSSPVFTIQIKKAGETVADYAKKYGVDIWDIIFLSHYMYPDLAPKAPLRKGTTLFIPDVSKLDGCTNANKKIHHGLDGPTQWYSSLDNETPKEIAKKFNVPCKDLLDANRVRIADLKAHSRLIEGTRLQVSNLHQSMDEAVPYIHWTFPDSKFEDNPDPSYMMARKLNRKKGAHAKNKPIEQSFAVKVETEYDSASIPSSIVQAPANNTTGNTPQFKTPNKSKKYKSHPEQPVTPKRPKTAFMFFLHGEKERLKSKNVKICMPDLSRVAAEHWKSMPDETKRPFVEAAEKMRVKYEEDMRVYHSQMNEFKRKHPQWDDEGDADEPALKKQKSGFVNLFNKVVKLNEEGKRQAGNEFEYYYVLTYIPDLFWCHLAPLRKAGIFGPNRKKSEGRTKWMLVDEGEGKELDITGAVCQVVKSRCTRGCADADKEEWDIIDDFSATTSPETKSSAIDGEESSVTEDATFSDNMKEVMRCDQTPGEHSSNHEAQTVKLSTDNSLKNVDQDFKENKEPRKRSVLEKVMSPIRSRKPQADSTSGPKHKTMQSSLLSFLRL
mmetsp:Transcript_4218/g.8060  ORF Transcript_4218/g.8060 Transcript_4218/m.8060 type:complete len:821 (-) Transcript_4218:64-2526(-)|eukprot:CAMPEP_0176488546 /NCGR_PEP_ID=MMETSP0200_2-20121128/6771_1 /TAXON_ID=947934 /ORGANISM="Chaetoceros sp., Strain GSL56" /LENGTH=820 /DNA_ID=CAMNT_0017885545 /DNA_START=74 /DNA_END=2536 /DNA_ORIENTATION=+